MTDPEYELVLEVCADTTCAIICRFTRAVLTFTQTGFLFGLRWRKCDIWQERTSQYNPLRLPS